MPRFGFYQTEHKNNNHYMFIQKQIWERPDAVAFRYPKANALAKGKLEYQDMTFSDFGILTSRLAQSFMEKGLQENDAVLVLMPISMQFFSVVYALQKIGSTPVFLEDISDKEFIHSVLGQVNFKACIAFSDFFDKFSNDTEIGRISTRITTGPENSAQISLTNLFQNNNEAETISIEQNHMAQIFFVRDFEDPINSNPLGVVKDHHQVAAEYYSYQKIVTIIPDEVYLAYSIGMVGLALASGAGVALPVPFHSPMFKDQIQAAKFTGMLLDFPLSNHVMHNLNEGTIFKHIVSQAGLSSNDLVRLSKTCSSPIQLVYSNLEASPICSLIAKERIQKHKESADGVIVGNTVKGVNLKILAPTDKKITIADFMDWANYEVKKGEAGELLIAGEHIGKNYYNNELAIDKYKIVDDFSITWHRSGQMAREDDDGNIWILGPLKNAIKVDGKYITHSQGEILAMRDQSVKDAAYLLDRDNKPHLAVVTDNNTGMQERMSQLFNSNHLPLEKVSLVSQIPKEMISKNTDYERLKEMLN